jgi:hypothetical protein
MTAAVSQQSRPAPLVPDLFAERELLNALGMALALVDRAHARTVAFTLNELGEIDLPSAVPATADDQALLRALATLYLASQLEFAGLVPAVESLSGLAISGGVSADLGKAASLVAEFWKARNQRLHEAERRAFFSQLFGAETSENAPGARPATNAAFDDTMITLCESLYKLDERTADAQYGSPPAQATIRAAALEVANNLLHRGPGIAVYAAQEIIATIRQCIQILQQTSIQHAFSEHNVWGVVRAVLSRNAHAEPDVDNYVRRGKAGLMVLSWLADSLPAIGGGLQLVVSLDHPVIAAAQEWLESSLAVRESAAPTSGEPSA